VWQQHPVRNRSRGSPHVGSSAQAPRASLARRARRGLGSLHFSKRAATISAEVGNKSTDQGQGLATASCARGYGVVRVRGHSNRGRSSSWTASPGFDRNITVRVDQLDHCAARAC